MGVNIRTKSTVSLSCTDLILNVHKTKELIDDFRKKEAKALTPVYIDVADVVGGI